VNDCSFVETFPLVKQLVNPLIRSSADKHLLTFKSYQISFPWSTVDLAVSVWIGVEVLFAFASSALATKILQSQMKHKNIHL